MKKLIALIAILALATVAFAIESDPSETVGFVKIDANVGYTPFSLPFTFYDASHTETMTLDDIVGDQFTGGAFVFQSDQIIDINNGNSGWYDTDTGSWSGALTSFADNHGNYAQVISGHPDVDFYLAGQVDRSSINFGTMNVGYNPVGIREAGEVSVSDLDLVSSGFTGGSFVFQSDQIIDMNTGNSAWYDTDTSTWSGSLTITNISPGHVYYIQVLSGHSSFNWTYDPTSKSAKKVNKSIQNNINRGNL